MTLRTAAIALLSLVAIPLAHAQERKAMDDYKPALTREDLRSVSPALEAYAKLPPGGVMETSRSYTA